MNFLNIQSINYLKTNTSDVIKQVLETHDPAAITVNDRIQAVVLDPVCYQKTLINLPCSASLLLAEIRSRKATSLIMMTL
jgi:hypothetical protein